MIYYTLLGFSWALLGLFFRFDLLHSAWTVVLAGWLAVVLAGWLAVAAAVAVAGRLTG